ncbi:dermonecrotic toxin domain-containing protein [Pseudomonas putida]|uniref:dermonecrotic toxin domain-containing protein n=1 Tax=Pseudomonas putida TaxID=303 RepID=UPI003906B10B
MTAQTRFQTLDSRLEALLPPIDGVEPSLDIVVEQLWPNLSITARTLYFGTHHLLQLVGFHLFDGGTFRVPTGSQPRHASYPVLNLPVDFASHIDRFCKTIRQDLHARLASYWLERDSKGLTRLIRLASHYRDQLDAEIRLRSTDQTLSPGHAQLLRTCLMLPRPWQRRHLPVTSRPQTYRLLLASTAPNWRCHVPGFLVLTEQGPEGRLLEHDEPVGLALLCSVAHGIEAFDSLAALHAEVCERLEDPLQSGHLLAMMVEPGNQQQARQAERLRYDWYTEDPAEFLAFAIRDAQTSHLTHAWQQAWEHGQQRSIEQLDSALAKALDIRQTVGSRGPMANRYGLLLEKHLPNWLRTTSRQGVTHIMQAMQEQVVAIQAASAPGILTLEQFRQQHSLLNWVNERLREYLQRDPGLDYDPRDISISVTLARQTGPIVNPLPISGTSGYVPVASRPQVGDTIEVIRHTYRLDELALLNIAWFDVDYWLTARVYLHGDQPLPALTPQRVKDIVRRLNAGSGYQAYLRTQLLDTPEGRWRRAAHGQITRTRMNAEAVKARYARHFLPDTFEQGYGWASTVISAPDSNNRPHYNEQQVIAQQLLVQGDTLLGVLLLVSPENSKRIVLYCPDVPDRRFWREYHDTKALILAARNDSSFQDYLTGRLPQASGKLLGARLKKGRIGAIVTRQTITGNLFEALYRAEVKSLIAQTDTATRSNEELLGEFSVNVLRLVLDLVTFVLPQRALLALAFGRMAISIWDGFEAFDQDDHAGALHHAVAALGHASAGLNEMAGSSLMRRAMRGLPKPPPVPLPQRYQVVPDVGRLRYRIDSVHGEAVYEQLSVNPGLSQYFVRDNQGHYFNVSFDGSRWRATDPDQPYAYLKLPITRSQNGSWIVDSAVHWHEGLPDIAQLLGQCRLEPRLDGVADEHENHLFSHGSTLYLQLLSHQLPVRRHLLPGHYHLVLPAGLSGTVPAWAVLRRALDAWQIRVRQPGRGSDWLALPEDYSPSRGNSLSKR